MSADLIERLIEQTIVDAELIFDEEDNVLIGVHLHFNGTSLTLAAADDELIWEEG